MSLLRFRRTVTNESRVSRLGGMFSSVSFLEPIHGSRRRAQSWILCFLPF
jgi:hypothetical protein